MPVGGDPPAGGATAPPEGGGGRRSVPSIPQGSNTACQAAGAPAPAASDGASNVSRNTSQDSTGASSYHFSGHAAYIERATRESGVDPEALHRGQWGIVSRISDLCSQASGRTREEVATIAEKAAGLRDDLRVQCRIADLMLQELEACAHRTGGPTSLAAGATDAPGSPAATEVGRRSRGGVATRQA